MSPPAKARSCATEYLDLLEKYRDSGRDRQEFYATSMAVMDMLAERNGVDAYAAARMKEFIRAGQGPKPLSRSEIAGLARGVGSAMRMLAQPGF